MDKDMQITLNKEEHALLVRMFQSEGFTLPVTLAKVVAGLQDKLARAGKGQDGDKGRS